MRMMENESTNMIYYKARQKRIDNLLDLIGSNIEFEIID